MTDNIRSEIALPERLDGVVLLQVRLSAAPPDGVFDELSSQVQGRLRLADMGAYVVQAVGPESSAAEALRERRIYDGMAWEFRAVAIDARVAQVIHNMLVAFSKLIHPVEWFSMQAGDMDDKSAVALPSLGSRSLDQTYPPLSRRLRFEVRRAPRETRRGGRRVELAFAETLDDDSLARVIERLELWSSISLGAYAETEGDLWSGEAVIFDALPDIMDDYAVEMPIDKFGAPEIAWNSLLNLCGRCDRDIARITSVTIE